MALARYQTTMNEDTYLGFRRALERLCEFGDVIQSAIDTIPIRRMGIRPDTGHLLTIV